MLNDSQLRILDASWWLDGRDAFADFQKAHIPGAIFFDLDKHSDQTSSLPHMMPEPATFSRMISDLGISAQDQIVVYDTQGLFSAARVWWMFRTMGAKNVKVLDGGLPKWTAETRPIESGIHAIPPAPYFAAKLDVNAIADLETVMASLTSETQLLDARPAARFKAETPEPRLGMRGGHMPGAHNLPYGQLLHADKTMKSAKELEAAFLAAGINLDKPIINTCGSGVTAAVLTLALAVLNIPSRLYDGSWSEWGSRTDTPVHTGD